VRRRNPRARPASRPGRGELRPIGRGRRALDFFVIEGIKTTIPLHRRILDDVHAMAKVGDGGVGERAIVDRGVAGAAARDQAGGDMRQ